MRPILLSLKTDKKELIAEAQVIEEQDQAEPLRNLRILLNKLTKENYTRIEDTMLNGFIYSEEILKTLAVIINRRIYK